MDTELILYRLREYVQINRLLHQTTTQQILPRMHYGPDKSELVGAMAMLEKALNDVEFVLDGGELELHVSEVEL